MMVALTPTPITGLTPTAAQWQGWFNQSVANAAPDAINPANYGTLVGDGVTDNSTTWLAFLNALSTAGVLGPSQTVTISIASPCVVTLTNHLLRVNDAFVFSTTGALPTGITAGTVYYVLETGMTNNTFQFWATNNNGISQPTEVPINTSGSQSGVQSIQVYSSDQHVIIPPGTYYMSAGYLPIANVGQKRLVIDAYGAVFLSNNLITSPQFLGWSSVTGEGGYAGTFSSLNNNPSPGPQTLTMTTVAQAGYFYPGQWICLMGLDTQNTFGVQTSFPPNNHYFDFLQVYSVNASTGVVTFWQGQHNKESYLSSWPLFYAGTGIGANAFASPGGGPCTAFAMHQMWDQDLVVRGITLNGTTLTNGHRITLIDCIVNGVCVPSVSKIWSAKRCRFYTNLPTGISAIETDKLVELLEFEDCELGGGLTVQSSCIKTMRITGCTMYKCNGTARKNFISNSMIEFLNIGCTFGATESVLLENTYVSSLGIRAQTPSPTSGWTFSNGVLKQPISTTIANTWAVPGRFCYFNDIAGANDNMGLPFRIMRVFVDGSSNFCMDTTLAALPGGALQIVPHPCPKITVRGCTGNKDLVALVGSDDEPIFSRMHCAVGTNLNASASFRIWGTLISATINVVMPFTGTGTFTVQATCPGFTQPALGGSTMTLIVNAVIAGKRVVTPAGVTGNQAGDTLAAYGDWLGGLCVITTGGSNNSVGQPIVEIEILTDQGVTKYDMFEWWASNDTQNRTYFDTGFGPFP